MSGAVIVSTAQMPIELTVISVRWSRVKDASRRRAASI